MNFELQAVNFLRDEHLDLLPRNAFIVQGLRGRGQRQTIFLVGARCALGKNARNLAFFNLEDIATVRSGNPRRKVRLAKLPSTASIISRSTPWGN